MNHKQLTLTCGVLQVLLAAIAFGPVGLAITAVFLLGVAVTELARRGP